MFKVLKVWTEAAVRHSCVGTVGQYVKLLCVMGRSDITFGRQDAVKCPVSVHKLAWQADFPTHEQELGKCILDSISSMHGTGWKSEAKWCEDGG